MTFLAYLAEQTIVHLIDWLIGGVAGYLIGRGGKANWIGVVLALLYGTAIAGSFLGQRGPDYFGIAAAVIAFVVMLWFGRKRARARAQATAL